MVGLKRFLETFHPIEFVLLILGIGDPIGIHHDQVARVELDFSLPPILISEQSQGHSRVFQQRHITVGSFQMNGRIVTGITIPYAITSGFQDGDEGGGELRWVGMMIKKAGYDRDYLAWLEVHLIALCAVRGKHI